MTHHIDAVSYITKVPYFCSIGLFTVLYNDTRLLTKNLDEFRRRGEKENEAQLTEMKSEAKLQKSTRNNRKCMSHNDQ